MRPENKACAEFLKQHGINVKVSYCRSGSMRGSWRLYNPSLPWTEELAAKLNSLGFHGYGGEPLNKYYGNGGVFSASVYGHPEFVTQARAAAAARLQASITDGGRAAAGFVKEKADCTVRATAHALGIEYAEAHRKLAALGRKNRSGFRFSEPHVLQSLGLRKLEAVPGRTIGQVVPKLGAGRFICRIARHVFAVVDGKLQDAFLPDEGKHIKAVYQVAA